MGQKMQRDEMQSMIQKEIKKEIGELQNGYNVKLNSLCSIVEQIQINNDRLSSQTFEMMATVNDLCNSLQRERSKYKDRNNRSMEDKHILKLQHEMESIKEIILQSRTRYSNECPLYVNDASDDEYDDEHEVVMWLANEVKMPQYIDNFIVNGFDEMSVIQEMSLNELELIGIKLLGHRMKIYRFIRKLCDEQSSNDQLCMIRDHNLFMRNNHESFGGVNSVNCKRQRHKSMEQYVVNDKHLSVKKMRHPKRMSLQEMYSEIPLNERSYSSNM